MTNEIVACMGGFCSQRANCRHYFSMNETYSERLCGDVEEPEYIKDKKPKVGTSIEIWNGKRRISRSENIP